MPDKDKIQRDEFSALLDELSELHKELANLPDGGAGIIDALNGGDGSNNPARNKGGKDPDDRASDNPARESGDAADPAEPAGLSGQGGDPNDGSADNPAPRGADAGNGGDISDTNQQSEIPQPPKRSRAEVNRANSLKSTGPKTPEGRAISSLNGLRHGLCAHALLLPPDDMEAFRRFSKALYADLEVDGVLERTLAQNMADSQYQIERARAIENNTLQLAAYQHVDPAQPDQLLQHTQGMVKAFKENEKTIELMSRYATRHNRIFLQNHERLRLVQRERRNSDYARMRENKKRHNEDFARHQQTAATGQATANGPAGNGQATGNAQATDQQPQAKQPVEANSGFARQPENGPSGEPRRDRQVARPTAKTSPKPATTHKETVKETRKNDKNNAA